jgi:uncharacterized membrane protein
MDRTTPENSIPFSSMNPPSTTSIVFMAEHEEIDIDNDRILVERNFLTRNANVGGYGGDESLRQRQLLLHMPIQRNGSRRYVLRGLIAFFLIICIVNVIIDYRGDQKIDSSLKSFLNWTHAHPYRGIIAVILCYIIATVFFVPGSILTFGAGYAIGSAVDNKFLGVLLATAVSIIRFDSIRFDSDMK